jgi:hypothetical protein
VSTITALAGGDEFELAVVEINALAAEAHQRIQIAALSLVRATTGAAPATVPVDLLDTHPSVDAPVEQHGHGSVLLRGLARRRSSCCPLGDVDAERGARAPRSIRPSSRRPRAGTGPAAGGAR